MPLQPYYQPRSVEQLFREYNNCFVYERVYNSIEYKTCIKVGALQCFLKSLTLDEILLFQAQLPLMTSEMPSGVKTYFDITAIGSL
jgi:hypothetical protein